MRTAARWIRCGPAGPRKLHATCAGLALAQGSRAAPLVLWAQAETPTDAEPWKDDGEQFLFALIVPLRFAPGRRSRWCAWGLAPALATYRQFGVRAYFDEEALCMNGRRLCEARARMIGACAVVASAFLPRTNRAFAEWPERALEAAFRERVEAQHGWQFENCWPSPAERAEIAEALSVEAAGAT